MVVFIILKGFLESWKNWRFSPPGPCVKNVILGISQTCIFLIQMGKYLPFKCPAVSWWWFSSVLKTFQKVEKIEVFDDRGPARELSFWGLSHFQLFLTQMSKYLLFKCPVVNWWLFSSFLTAYWRVQKIEDFPHPGPAWKMSFWAFHKLAYFSSKWANIYLSSVLGSTGGGFHQF